ncbi:hypothetical protein ACRQF6_05900 [Actinotignum sp. GS-2025f]|uniref:Uncharacterized protein n=1 Tax=Actinotignum schaalii FB123-CNA-2 TaxID=883067 RepID=S2VLC0_9ACTO|nr:hypothetical protein [Actinotignum sp. SLA_B059]EPD26830.1 hypothetical protein HMPREF9237_00762 [Actinotignum schaalii FB123-CNA-2]MDY5128254.1 hypothetical protein [Actinotignum sp. SLA_B059]
MVNARLDERANEFAAHLQRIGELIEPGFSLSRQSVAKAAFPAIRLSGDIHVAHLLTIRFDYEVFLNQETGLLAVNESTFSVIHGRVGKEPLVRWDYIRSPRSNIPCAHVQVHSHRDEWTHALLLGGNHSRRSRRRTKNNARTPRIADVHFPVGGRRFRPCLEEIILFVIDEFGAACTPQARKALQHGIQEWDENQLRAAVRNNPTIALQAFEA